jgi:hypothetical protein
MITTAAITAASRNALFRRPERPRLPLPATSHHTHPILSWHNFIFGAFD